MVSKQNSTADLSPDNKKRRRVGFSESDVGIEANECIKVFLVSCPEEVEAADSFCLDSIDLNQFFGEDGKIYGYNGLKIHVWFSSISFHAFADISFQSRVNGAKGTTELKPVLEHIFGKYLVEQKDEFLQTFSRERHYFGSVVSNGESLGSSKGCKDASDKCLEETKSDTEQQVIRMDFISESVRELYGRLVPLVLLLVDGGSPIDVTDPKWDIYFVVEKKSDKSGDTNFKLLGFLTVYRFYHYPDSVRLRIGQILVLPPYQGQSHGRRLLETLNSFAVSENAYDVTAEEPSDYLQHVRVCIDSIRLLDFEPIKPVISSVTSHLKKEKLTDKASKFHCALPSSLIEDARKVYKINKKQFVRCWEVLIYLNIDSDDPNCMKTYRTFISDRMKVDILGKSDGAAGKQVINIPNENDPERTFVMFRAGVSEENASLDDGLDENRKSQEEQLSLLVDERMEEIVKAAKKILVHRVSQTGISQ